MKITKFDISQPLEIVVPNKKRKFMDETHNGFAYRCLPMTVVNGFGWSVLNRDKFRVIWNGGNLTKDLFIVYDSLPDGKAPHRHGISHFGSGILTFNLGFLIRTPSDINLYIKGPANNPKRGITALEGIVETDWLNFTFTMNWKVTEPNYEIVFERDEPICTFFPYPRNYIEEVEPVIRDMTCDPETYVKYKEYEASRSQYNATLATNGAKGQRDYLRGFDKDGSKFSGHQTSISGKPFSKINE